jgi:6-phosphogluconate dehydrogenase
MSESDFGLIGLAVMGQNLVLNIESRGFRVSVFNRTTSVTQDFVAAHAGRNLHGAFTLEAFVGSLSRPRKIQIMVKAGGPVDAVISQLVPLLKPGDLIIDGGNSLFTDTERRSAELERHGILFVGAGVSGGEEGALKGPSIMPGGPESSWKLVRPIYESIAAKVNGEPCVTLIGPGGSGHYVKMVHNGIEYGDMQLICEAYNIFQTAGFSAAEMAAIFAEWNAGDLESYLIQITGKSSNSRTLKPAALSSTSSSIAQARKGRASGRCKTLSRTRS